MSVTQAMQEAPSMPLREDSRGRMSNAAVTLHRYDQLAQINRPRDESALARECSRLRSTGLTARDIATALRIDLGEVLALLQMCDGSRP